MALSKSPSSKTLLVLGASYAGLSTTHYLLRHILPSLSSAEPYDVVLVASSSQVMCRPACPRALISDEFFDQAKLFVDIANQLEQYPAGSYKFVKGTAVQVDHQARTTTVRMRDGTETIIPFHALIIATGASTPSPLLGLNVNENALRESWSNFRKAIPTAKSIVIAGGGPAGVEVAGELGEYLNGRPGWFSSALSSPKVNITLITTGDRILPALRPAIAATAASYLRFLGVTILLNTKVSTVTPSDAGLSISSLTSPATLTLSTSETIDAHLYIPTTGTKPNTSFLPPSLLAHDSRITTNPQTLRVDTAGPLIYSIGDCSTAFRPAIHNIIAAVPVLCNNIHHDLLTSSSPSANLTSKQIPAEKHFHEDTRETQLVPLGTKKGVGAAMGWRLPGWLVWVIKGRDYWVWTTGKLWSGRQW
ncbi:FAD/NAD(P)-binding domain-containing protein [Paraphoma chrysanthemicola]|uniref:FAD/NAD(P)-binding domain-containing protein n=1 Tax=Paraphoma chrysanthemicola TaxID=798071 RepID=A0A8K0VT34_9PLEO|nr:FAD/NAD(P)-binding domain-containing protein [Paraphoma chrysanthemicola]